MLLASILDSLSVCEQGHFQTASQNTFFEYLDSIQIDFKEIWMPKKPREMAFLQIESKIGGGLKL